MTIPWSNLQVKHCNKASAINNIDQSKVKVMAVKHSGIRPTLQRCCSQPHFLDFPCCPFLSISLSPSFFCFLECLRLHPPPTRFPSPHVPTSLLLFQHVRMVSAHVGCMLSLCAYVFECAGELYLFLCLSVACAVCVVCKQAEESGMCI